METDISTDDDLLEAGSSEEDVPPEIVSQAECPPEKVLKLTDLINGLRYIHPAKLKSDLTKPIVTVVKTPAVLATEKKEAYYSQIRKQYLEFLASLWAEMPFQIDTKLKNNAEVLHR